MNQKLPGSLSERQSLTFIVEQPCIQTYKNTRSKGSHQDPIGKDQKNRKYLWLCWKTTLRDPVGAGSQHPMSH